MGSVRKKGSAYDENIQAHLMKHCGGTVMAWACMAASGVGSLICTDDELMTVVVYKNILSVNLRRNVFKL